MPTPIIQYIRCTHTGLLPDGRVNASGVLINDLDTGQEQQLRKVPVYVPVGGYIDIPASTRSLLSYNEGVIRKFHDEGVIVAQLIDPGDVEPVQAVLHGSMTGSQIINLGGGDHLIFDEVVFTQGTGITLDTATPYDTTLGQPSVGRITLSAGRTYKLRGNLTTLTNNGADGYVMVTWVDVTNDVDLGKYITFESLSFASRNTGPSGDVVAYVSPTTEILVELRIYSNVNITALGYQPEGVDIVPWFIVEDMGPST